MPQRKLGHPEDSGEPALEANRIVFGAYPCAQLLLVVLGQHLPS